MKKRKSVGLAAIYILLLGVLIVSSTTASASTNRSGLSWGSGVFKPGGNISDFENWRGRLVDMVVDFTYRFNWSQITNSSQAAFWDGKPYQLVLAVPFFPEDGASNFAACASGSYNSYWSTFGTNLVSHHQGNAIIRLGWEFNGDWYNHKVTTSNMTDWVTCFQQVVTSIRKTAPSVKIDWNVSRGDGLKAAGRGDPAQVYPGDSYVDYIGIDEYDMWPPATTQSAWDTYHMGGAYGIQHWIDFASTHGKKVSFPEWGLNHGDSHHGNDNPYFIGKMWSLFNSLNSTGKLAYEGYFDQGPGGTNGALDVPGLNPNSSSIYNAANTKAPALPVQVVPADGQGLTGTAPARTFTVNATPVTLSDIAGDPAADAITSLVQQGVFKGFPDGTFRPELGLTRAQLAVIYAKALGLAPQPAAALTFSDRSQIGDWAAPAVAAMVQQGILKGYPDGSFRPNATISRAELASLLARVLQQRGIKVQASAPVISDQLPAWAADAIRTAAAAGLLSPAANGTFNPTAPATRGQTAQAFYALLTLLQGN